MSAKIPLVYILSSGRSGSTLLELLLGTHPRAWTVGEIQFFPWAVKNDQPCGCQVPMTTCPFWGPLCADAGDTAGTTDDLQYFRRRNNQGKVVRWSHLAGALGAALMPAEAAAAHAYGARNHGFLSAVLERIGEYAPDREVPWLIDSSKDPYRLRWLEASGLFDIRVVHLIKDPRAFVYSMAGPDGDGRLITRFTGRWAVENAIAHALCRSRFPGRTVTLWYEDLARDPAAALGRIGQMLGLDFSPAMLEGFRQNESHGVAGNSMRGRSDPVRLDERWRRGLPPWQQQAIWAATAPTRVLLAGAA